MPPLVLYMDKTPAFLLAWRRATLDGRPGWEARLAVPQTIVDVRGEQVHGLASKWAPTELVRSLPTADYGMVPRPPQGQDEVTPLRMPPLVLWDSAPAFLLAWQRHEVDGRTAWEGRIALLRPWARPDGAVPQLVHRNVGAGSLTRLPEADYSAVPRLPAPDGG